MLTILLAAVVGYLLGAIPSAELAARLRGRRIFEVGSGNMGAMNTARNLGIGLGLAVLAADIGKGAAATAAGLALARAAGLGETASIVAGLAGATAAVTGHAWSAFVRWRGGKALATIFGASLPLYPWGGLAGLAMILVVLAATRNAHTAALATLLAVPALVGLTSAAAGMPAPLAWLLALGVLPQVVISWLRHRRPSPPAAPR